MKKENCKLDNLQSKIKQCVMWVESLLAIFIIASVFVGFKDVLSFLIEVFKLEAVNSYDLFQTFLSYVLLLVIALELALMLVEDTPQNVIEVILYAIARKMLVHTSNAFEMFLGVLSLAVVFFIKTYSFSKYNNNLNIEENDFS